MSVSALSLSGNLFHKIGAADGFNIKIYSRANFGACRVIDGQDLKGGHQHAPPPPPSLYSLLNVPVILELLVIYWYFFRCIKHRSKEIPLQTNLYCYILLRFLLLGEIEKLKQTSSFPHSTFSVIIIIEIYRMSQKKNRTGALDIDSLKI